MSRASSSVADQRLRRSKSARVSPLVETRLSPIRCLGGGSVVSPATRAGRFGQRIVIILDKRFPLTSGRWFTLFFRTDNAGLIVVRRFRHVSPVPAWLDADHGRYGSSGPTLQNPGSHTASTSLVGGPRLAASFERVAPWVRLRPRLGRLRCAAEEVAVDAEGHGQVGEGLGNHEQA